MMTSMATLTAEAPADWTCGEKSNKRIQAYLPKQQLLFKLFLSPLPHQLKLLLMKLDKEKWQSL